MLNIELKTKFSGGYGTVHRSLCKVQFFNLCKLRPGSYCACVLFVTELFPFQYIVSLNQLNPFTTVNDLFYLEYEFKHILMFYL